MATEIRFVPSFPAAGAARRSRAAARALDERGWRKADMFVVTGLDLELWIPAIEDKANNPRVRPGGVGYVSASTGVELLNVPTSVSRAEGDIHLFGNPHYWQDPNNVRLVVATIARELSELDPANAAGYAARLARLLPQARLQPKGVLATEGFVSFPLAGHPGHALSLGSHFFADISDLRIRLQARLLESPLSRIYLSTNRS